jgi:hypothetical protein
MQVLCSSSSQAVVQQLVERVADGLDLTIQEIWNKISLKTKIVPDSSSPDREAKTLWVGGLVDDSESESMNSEGRTIE